LKNYRKLPWHGKNIYFLGFMGSGKSRIGSAFAQLLGWPFHDTDELIEQRTGKIIRDIFATEGEEGFRNHETDVIREISAWKNNVIALGGGAVLCEVNWELISASGITICLTAPVAVLSERISRSQHRPLMDNLSEGERRRKISDMLAQRQRFYNRAQFTFESTNDRPIVEFVSTIFEILMEKL
jgi:shikimate kinase